MADFKSLLSKIGNAVLSGLKIVSSSLPIVTPIATSLLPQTPAVVAVEKDLPAIASIITNVEAMGQALQLKGPDKLKAAAPLVGQILLQSDLLATHKISNPTLFNSAATKIAD